MKMNRAITMECNFKSGVMFLVGLSISCTAVAQQRTWRVSGPPHFSIATRLAVQDRTAPWVTHRVQNDQNGDPYAAFSLPNDQRGYDIRITPLDRNGRPTQKPLNTKQPVIWADLPNTLLVAFGIEVKPDGRKYFPAASIPIVGGRNTYDLEDYSDEIKDLFGREWNTTYVDLAGRNQDAFLKLQEESGSYRGAVQGRLSNLHYFPDPDADRVIVDGSWAVGQTKGVFVFSIDVNNGPGAFQGQYRLSNERRWRTWNGTPR